MSDDCTVKHPALTGLDHGSMAAAYEASFIGAFGRKPRWTRGSGQDDGEYWIGVSDHYGAFGDGICRAGWSRYWELKMTTGVDALDPKLGDEPARFLPNMGTVQPNPGTPPSPPPEIEGDPVRVSGLLLSAFADFDAKLLTLDAKADLQLATLRGLLADVQALKARPTPNYVGRIFGYTITLTPQEKS